MSVAGSTPETLGANSTARAVSARESVLARALRAPTLLLVAIVGISTLLRASIGVGGPSPWILPDEILYAELAKAIADGGQPAVRGDTGAHLGRRVSRCSSHRRGRRSRTRSRPTTRRS